MPLKKLFLFLLLLLMVTVLSAQHHKIRAGLFRKWYVGAFEEVKGNYSLAIDTVTDYYELYADEDDGFWSEQYEYHYSEVYDSVRVTIKRDTILYDNEIFSNVYTIRAMPKYHYYYMAARNDRDRTLVFIMYPEGTFEWLIYISDTEKNGWQGIWKKTEIADAIVKQ